MPGNTNILLAIDPGPEQSAYVRYADRLHEFGILKNQELLKLLRKRVADNMSCEGVASYGMPVGKETFDTCIWIGRFAEAWGKRWSLIYRPNIKMFLCGSLRAKDSHVRQVLLDKFGPGRQKAVGTKRAPGPLYGITSHMWSALAVAVTWFEAPQMIEWQEWQEWQERQDGGDRNKRRKR